MAGRTSITHNMAIAFVVLLITSTQVNAEWIMDLYTGVGFTQPHDAQVNLPDAGITGTHQSLSFDAAPVLGGRIGYWLESLPYVGFALDTSYYFGPDQREQDSLTDLCITGIGCSTAPEHIKKFDNNMTAIALDVMLRYPLLVSAQFTKGRLQPYLAVGPALFVASLKDTGNFIPEGQSSTSTSVGLQIGAGLTFLFTNRIGAFVEYRDNNFQAKDHYYNATVAHGITLGNTLGTATFNIQTILGGVRFHF
jgi:opacity protein-like surface antigen